MACLRFGREVVLDWELGIRICGLASCVTFFRTLARWFARLLALDALKLVAFF